MVYFSNIKYGNYLLISEKKKKIDAKQTSYLTQNTLYEKATC